MAESKVWFITGCSTGFGREIAKKVILEGYKVVVTARNMAQIENLSPDNENVLVLKLDVTDKNQVREAVNQTIVKFGRIDVLVNNAGIGYFSSVEESIEEETRKMFEINFWGLMNVTNEVLPHFRSQKSGHIINLSSISGLASSPAVGYYNATKYAVEGISESLAEEVAVAGIKVTLIEPSSFRTDWAGRSANRTQTTISEYKGTVGKRIDQPSGQEAGDPKKLADSVLAVAESEKPPLRLLLGGDAYEIATKKFTTLLNEIEDWKETTISADFKE
ncbi:NADP-dependent 3-hydroxy acid dehydrogenase YdfG [Halobacillus karajensis]|uniref:Oxidoreductase SadH n=1 Tax=Halobacillus karajensis TaxID=195088 RepID=A0A024P6V5_9BACI|nr:oxidoreductase [Halobacillus karajensis]CDQ18157.1 Putative oxidoreductase SadH [Halobacillus karajensis]CDQ24508.1 Putative oxidoreductase SadH [Halobacillus karajensis]CDQ29244.1 Putative oxidoreductase SadH [Halobacillus karajensis]SEH58182.1 NADP-dependent 3-hydroxy acid dehydrogenase YdfG [Halobacillus karajensis]